jgi:hypothetical protein
MLCLRWVYKDYEHKYDGVQRQRGRFLDHFVLAKKKGFLDHFVQIVGKESNGQFFLDPGNPLYTDTKQDDIQHTWFHRVQQNIQK